MGGSKRIPMRFTPKIDAPVPLDLQFLNEKGVPVELGKLFRRKPVILNLVYFNCPLMCTEVLNGLVQSMRTIPHEGIHWSGGHWTYMLHGFLNAGFDDQGGSRGIDGIYDEHADVLRPTAI